MAKKTQLMPHALPGALYGSFAGKTEASGRVIDRITQLMPYAVPGRLYGSFDRSDGASPRTLGRITQLMPYALPGRLYGSFDRAAAPAAASEQDRAIYSVCYSVARNVGYSVAKRPRIS